MIKKTSTYHFSKKMTLEFVNDYGFLIWTKLEHLPHSIYTSSLIPGLMIQCYYNLNVTMMLWMKKWSKWNACITLNNTWLQIKLKRKCSKRLYYSITKFSVNSMYIKSRGDNAFCLSNILYTNMIVLYIYIVNKGT